MFAILMLSCCLNMPLDITVDTEMLRAGNVLPLPQSDARRAVDLGYVPGPGLARRLSRLEIVTKIQNAGFATDDLQLPESILIRRQARTLDPEEVRQAIEQAFKKQFPTAAVTLINADAPAVQVGMRDVDISAVLPARFDANQPVFVRLDVRSGGSLRTVFVRSVVRIEVVQPVIRTRIAANSEIREEALEWKPAPMESAGQVPNSFDGLQGMLAKRDLEPGQVLKTDLLYAPLYVRKGEAVTVKSSFGGVTIAATMRAMSAGHLGDSIPVQHLSGNGSATARVVGPRTLEVLPR